MTLAPPQRKPVPPSRAALRLRTLPVYTELRDSQAIAPETLVPAHLLDGGEIVILAIKPSLWFILFKSFRWVAMMLLVAACATWVCSFFPSMTADTIIKGALMLAAARVGFAVLQWASRLYVLTNRRIMRLTGIMNVDLFECPLTRIQNSALSLSWYERIFGLGTIAFSTAGAGSAQVFWTHVNHPLELYEQIRSAISRAQRWGSCL